MALSAIIMAGLIIIAFLLRYLLRRYRKYLMEKIGSRERHVQSEQELAEVTVKKRGGHATTKSEKSVDACANSTERSLWGRWTPCFVNYKNDIKNPDNKTLKFALLFCYCSYLMRQKKYLHFFFWFIYFIFFVIIN